jgi:hypothetical protein
LDLTEDEVNKVMMGSDGGEAINVPVTEVIKLIEELSRLH